MLKVDDDVFVHMPRLQQFLRGLLYEQKAIIFGNVASGWKPVRDVNSKYYISNDQYDGSVYPPFVTGPSYMLSKEASQDILTIVWEEPYIFLEDVFLTGILPSKLSIPRRLVLEFKNNAERIPVPFLGCTLLRTISVHNVRPEEQLQLFTASRNPSCGPF
jgi:hypothetical protein